MTTATDKFGWGGGPWGETPWGTGEAALVLLSALAVRENVVRIEFSAPPLLDKLLTPHDASNPARFSIVVVSGAGPRGETPRPVLPVLVEVASVEGAGGRVLDVWTDRHFTGYPAIYRVSSNGLVSSGGSPLSIGANALFFGVEAGKAPPVAENLVASRDILIAQVARDLIGTGISGDVDAILGTLQIDGTGDYATSSPIASYRGRVLRRAISVVGSFAHLPVSYGTSLPNTVKGSFRRSVSEDVAAQIEAQVKLEPETISVTCEVISNGSVTTYKIKAKSRVGEVSVSVPG